MLDNLTLTFFRTITSQVYPQAIQLLQEAMKYFEGGMASGQQEKLLGVQSHTSALWSFNHSITHKSEAPLM